MSHGSPLDSDDSFSLKSLLKFRFALYEYVKCFEDKAVTCDTPILQHFIAVLCTFQRHIQDERGNFEERVEQLKPKL